METPPVNPLRSRIYSCTDLSHHIITPRQPARRTSMPQLAMQSPTTPSSQSPTFCDSLPSTPTYHYPEQTLDSVRQQQASANSSRKNSEESMTSTEMPTWTDVKSQYRLVTHLLDAVTDPGTVALERKRALGLWTRKILLENSNSR
jgi:hypothetical protein